MPLVSLFQLNALPRHCWQFALSRPVRTYWCTWLQVLLLLSQETTRPKAIALALSQALASGPRQHMLLKRLQQPLQMHAKIVGLNIRLHAKWDPPRHWAALRMGTSMHTMRGLYRAATWCPIWTQQAAQTSTQALQQQLAQRAALMRVAPCLVPGEVRQFQRSDQRSRSASSSSAALQAHAVRVMQQIKSWRAQAMRSRASRLPLGRLKGNKAHRLHASVALSLRRGKRLAKQMCAVTAQAQAASHRLCSSCSPYGHSCAARVLHRRG
jgi:hypothetical protein